MKREARIAGRLQEPEIAIHDYGEVDGQMFGMRLVGAPTLTACSNASTLTPPRAVAIITQIASALDATRRTTKMHRDQTAKHS